MHIDLAKAQLAFLGVVVVVVAACSSDTDSRIPKLRIAGIPDQNATQLARRYNELTDYLSQKLGLEVEYVPSVDYAATVTAFEQDEVQLGWFGD